MKSREIHLTAYLKGEPKPENYKLVETELPAPGEGEVLVKNHYISVDPYMRGRMSGIRTYVDPFETGAVMSGGAVGEVIESRFDGLKPGDFVNSMFGWREAYVAPGKALQKVDTSKLPPQAYLGIAGLTGLTAYVGIKRIIDLKEGETMWMSAGAGAVGSAGIQFAKAMGATVVATAGGAEKCEFVKSLGADAVVDYKATDNLTQALQAAAPKGVDAYFENVGGTHFTAALNVLKQYGRDRRLRHDPALQRRPAGDDHRQSHLHRRQVAQDPGLHRHRPRRHDGRLHPRPVELDGGRQDQAGRDRRRGHRERARRLHGSLHRPEYRQDAGEDLIPVRRTAMREAGSMGPAFFVTARTGPAPSGG